MSESRNEWIMVGAIFFLLMGLIYVKHCYDDLQQQAVDHGFAEWRIISGRETEFKWKGEE